ncbi:MAG: class I SAM-dependent methyltransferase [Acidobacteriota bacterium]|nr:class I SAM-dependent methyltransferase [Acidobacteriota bacterium]
MTDKSYLDPKLYEYIVANSVRESDLLRRLRAETGARPNAVMQISADQGQFFVLLMHLLKARKTLEIGVFTGYSSLAVALALPADGKVVACDISEEYTAVARRYWQEAGVAGKIDLRIAPAAETLHVRIQDGQEGTFDFAFIDADKTGYAEYFELCLRLLRSGGLIALDNMLQSGKVIDPAVNDKDTVAIRELNARLVEDRRVVVSLLPIADGVTLAVKL